MDSKRRLGPQDPLGWIRDTRENKPENPDDRTRFSEEVREQPGVRENYPMEVRREIVHTDKTIPMEVKVTLKGQPVKETQTIVLEITVGGK
jgi:hypothetical protein